MLFAVLITLQVPFWVALREAVWAVANQNLILLCSVVSLLATPILNVTCWSTTNREHDILATRIRFDRLCHEQSMSNAEMEQKGLSLAPFSTEPVDSAGARWEQRLRRFENYIVAERL